MAKIERGIPVLVAIWGMMKWNACIAVASAVGLLFM